MTNAAIIIKPGREKPIVNQHPWIFSGAIDRVEGNPTPGDIVTVKSHDGRFLARGYWNPKSQIQVRILTWHDEPIDEDWWRRMLKRAIDARRSYNPQPELNIPTAYRVVNAENDFLPGLIVDRYGDWLVIQSLTLGIEQCKDLIVELLKHMVEPKGIYERSDVDVRHKEGLSLSTGRLYGEEPPQYITISEGEYLILVDVRSGHKTGYYLDQFENRRLFRELLKETFVSVTENCRILNLFSYTGSFGLVALGLAATYVINVDSSLESLKLAEKNASLLAKHDEDRALDDVEFIQADVFDYIHDQSDAGEQYDVIICDPPKFAHNAQQVEKAARGYKDLNLHCFKLVKPGGYLMTFSCSGAVSADLFQKIVFGALADSGRQAQILKHLGPGEDHPVALTFPEGAYLKGLLLRVY